MWIAAVTVFGAQVTPVRRPRSTLDTKPARSLQNLVESSHPKTTVSYVGARDPGRKNNKIKWEEEKHENRS
jgi:hypothetical protein